MAAVESAPGAYPGDGEVSPRSAWPAAPAGAPADVDALRSAMGSRSGTPRLAPLAASALGVVEIFLEGVERALGALPVPSDATLADLRSMIYSHIDVQLLPPRYVFLSIAGGGPVRSQREAYRRVADFGPTVVIRPKTMRGALPRGGRERAMRKVKLAIRRRSPSRRRSPLRHRTP